MRILARLHDLKKRVARNAIGAVPEITNVQNLADSRNELLLLPVQGWCDSANSIKVFTLPIEHIG